VTAARAFLSSKWRAPSPSGTVAAGDGGQMKRTEIETSLNESRNWMLATIGRLSEEQLRAPLTKSESDPESYWSVLDHFSHLALVEGDFTSMIRRQLAGSANPVGLLSDERGVTRTRDEIMAIVNAHADEFQRAHRDDTLSEVVALTGAARAVTLGLLAELSDEQLGVTLEGAPWGDGTIGSVLAANAGHATMHWRWVTEAGFVEPGLSV
jgi:hypothetical protein